MLDKASTISELEMLQLEVEQNDNMADEIKVLLIARIDILIDEVLDSIL